MEKKVLRFIDENQLIRKNTVVLVGTSGGPDSLALLHFLHSIKKEKELDIICISVDHGMRGEASLADFQYVEAICKKWGIEFSGTSLDVPAYKQKNNLSDEVAARELRYRFFSEQMEKFQADYLALGHHGDDQVETLLMSLARTANSSSFAGIPVKRPFGTGEIIRPFLCLTKAEIEMYCERNELTPRIDATNFETNYTRNYFRKHIVPLIKERNNNVHQTLGHLSKTLQEDEQYLQEEAKKVLDATTKFDLKRKTCSLNINLFLKRPPALQRRAFHLILNYLYDEIPSDLSYIHDEHFFSLLRHNKGHASLDFPLRLKLEKSYNQLRFYFPQQRQAVNETFFSKTLHIPGKTVLPDGSSLSADYTNSMQHDDDYSFTFHAKQVELPLHIRTRKPGDRMTWRGLNGSKKIKDVFIDYKIPVNQRDRWPLVVDAHGKIIWLVGLKKNYPNNERSEGIFIQLHYQQGDIRGK